jgi:hypothetical protein
MHALQNQEGKNSPQRHRDHREEKTGEQMHKNTEEAERDTENAEKRRQGYEKAEVVESQEKRMRSE